MFPRLMSHIGAKQPTMLLIFYLLPLFIALGVFYWRRLRDFVKRRCHVIELIDRIPGPKALPLIGSAYQFKWDAYAFAQQLQDWALIYSPLGMCRVWVGPLPVIFITDPEAAKDLLTSTTLLTKSVQYNIIVPWLGTGLLISTGEKWQRRRKMLTPTFHFNILNGFVDIFAREASILSQQIEQYEDTDKPFDLFPYLKRCTLDIICETSMGAKVDAQIHHHSEYVMAVERLTELVWKNQRLPWLQLKPIWYMTGDGFDYDRQIKIVSGFTRRVITERQEVMRGEMAADFVSAFHSDKKCLALLDLLLLMQIENKLTEEDIREEVDTFMFEGHGTTSSSLGWTFWRLGHHLDIQDKVFEELDGIFGDSDRLVEPEDLRQMKYLERVVKESLRLYPSVPLYARIMTEEAQIGPYMLPTGTTVAVVPPLIHRDEKSYPNPEVFDPDNFLPDRIAQRNPYAYLPFSAGQRNCIGQKFAIMEEKTILATILRRYYIRSMESIEDCKPQPEMVLKPPNGFEIKLFSRQQQNKL